MHNSLQKAPSNKGKNIRKCCLVIRVCTFPNREVSFVEVVEVYFRWMCWSSRGFSPTSLQKLSSVCTNTVAPLGLWNNKEKCVSLWSFVVCWQWADTDKSVDRWRLTCCDYLPLLELTVHQSRRPWEAGPADSIVAWDGIFMIQWPRKKQKKMCQGLQMCCHTSSLVYCYLDSQILKRRQRCNLIGTITGTYVLTLSINTNTHCYTQRLPPDFPGLHSDFLALITFPLNSCSVFWTWKQVHTPVWATGEMEERKEWGKREVERETVCVCV